MFRWWVRTTSLRKTGGPLRSRHVAASALAERPVPGPSQTSHSHPARILSRSRWSTSIKMDLLRCSWLHNAMLDVVSSFLPLNDTSMTSTTMTNDVPDIPLKVVHLCHGPPPSLHMALIDIKMLDLRRRVGVTGFAVWSFGTEFLSSTIMSTFVPLSFLIIDDTGCLKSLRRWGVLLNT